MPQGHPLDATELEYRRVLGARMQKAVKLAGLTKTKVAELIECDVPTFYQFLSGRRHVPPAVIERVARVTGVSTEELLADENAFMSVQGPTGTCPAGFLVEKATSRMRVHVLLICDHRPHGDEVAHHDPQGLDWRSAPGI